MRRIVTCNHCKEEFSNEEVIVIDEFYYCSDCLLRFQEGWEI